MMSAEMQGMTLQQLRLLELRGALTGSLPLLADNLGQSSNTKRTDSTGSLPVCLMSSTSCVADMTQL